MRNLGHLVRGVFAGAVLGAGVIGGMSRVLMRLLSFYDGRSPGFSWAGSAEILLYGAIVGSFSGLVYAAVRLTGLARSRLRGLGWGLLTYLATILTLPPHIAGTATPFAAIMPVVYLAFGLVFLLFGTLLARSLGPTAQLRG